MKKEEFLKELEQRIDILNDSEKMDIIAEYSQHIDQKIENGLSEEAAAGDFGNIKVLADEILSAYNVNLKYNKPKRGGDIKRFIVRSGKTVVVLLKKCGVFCIGLIQNCLHAASRAGKATVQFIKRQFERLKLLAVRSTKGAAHVKEEYDMQSGENDGNAVTELQSSVENETEEEDEMEKEQILLYPHKKKRGLLLQALSSIAHAVKSVCKWCVYCIILFTALPFVMGALGCLFMLGVIIVLAVQGYPLTGICIMTVGFCVTTASISCILLSYCSKKKREDTIETAMIQTEVQE